MSSSQSDDFRNGFISISTELLQKVLDEISAEMQNIANISLEQTRNTHGNNPNNLPFEEWLESKVGIYLDDVLPHNILNF